MPGRREWKVIRKERRQGQGGEKRGGGAETDDGMKSEREDLFS